MTLSASCEPRAFAVCGLDNVATLIDPARTGARIHVLGETDGDADLFARNDIPVGHKISLMKIDRGAPVTKYGHRIGHARQAIAAGEWVHLHNCSSDLDERSNDFDQHTGVPADNLLAYE